MPFFELIYTGHYMIVINRNMYNELQLKVIWIKKKNNKKTLINNKVGRGIAK